MNIRIDITLFFILTCLSCSEETVFKIHLPDASYNSKKPFSKGGLNDIYITQISENQLKIQSNNYSNDTVQIASYFFEKLFSHHVVGQFETASIVFLALDKSMAFNQFEHIKLQLRKATVTRITMQTKNGQFKFNAPPFGNDFTEERKETNIVYPPEPPQFDLKNEIDKKSIVECKVFKNSLTTRLLPSMRLVNLKRFCLEKQEIVIIYEIDSSCNYQSFVSLFDSVFTYRNQARNSMREIDSLCSERDLKRLYPIRLINKTLINSTLKSKY